MSPAAVLLAPLLIILPQTAEFADVDASGDTTDVTFGAFVFDAEVDEANQVRIEQRTTIRIIPRTGQVRSAAPALQTRRAAPPRMVERRMGKCILAAGIAGVEVDMGKRLILYLRDRRIVSAELERSCRSRDFYSGFYLSTNKDGHLCVDRDTLLSRSGANCKLTRMRQLVVDDD